MNAERNHRRRFASCFDDSLLKEVFALRNRRMRKFFGKKRVELMVKLGNVAVLRMKFRMKKPPSDRRRLDGSNNELKNQIFNLKKNDFPEVSTYLSYKNRRRVTTIVVCCCNIYSTHTTFSFSRSARLIVQQEG